VAAVLCALAVGLKYRFGYDDSLDVVGVHLVGGLVGTIGVGFLASASATAGVDGLLYGGGIDQLWRQGIGAGAVLAYSFVLTLIIGFAISKSIGFRLGEEGEVEGVDFVEHAETAYDFISNTGGSRGLVGASPTAPSAPKMQAATEGAKA